MTGDWTTGHDIFGSERMTDNWWATARAYDLENGDEISRSAVVVSQ